MKYGQVWSAHWEGGVGEWLRGQLEARGIDARAYGRYVLSLLTRPLDPADVSPQPTKSWERRRISEWAPVKIEALKRSAAVQCLINASDDQSSDIEQLVDELRAKLKEADENNARTGRREAKPRREASRPLSPSEMARLYYAAFPALASAVGPASLPSPPADDPASLSPPRRRRDGGHRRNVSCGKDWLRPKQVKQQAPRARRNTVHSHRHQNARCRNRKRERVVSERGEEPLPEWITDGDAWDADGRDRLRDFIRAVAPDDGYGTCDNAALDDSAPVPARRLYQRDDDSSPDIGGEGDDIVLFKDWVIEEDLPSPPLSPSEEESIARFEAKFDRSLEALWFTDREVSPLPSAPEPAIEIRDALPSPCGDGFASFCGSVWSNGDLAWEREGNALASPDSFRCREMSVTDLCHFRDGGRDVWRVGPEPDGEESMEVIYGRLKPLNLGEDDDVRRAERPAHLFAPGTGIFPETVLGPPGSVPHLEEETPRREASDASLRSLTALNHSSLYSSFTEVVPKAPGYVGDGVARKNGSRRTDAPREPDFPPPAGDEEDLLTSVRTHFRPIERESPEGARDRVVEYADGVTFPVDGTLDEVEFRRSGSGAMFLETGRRSPQRYMEYRTQGIDYSRLDVCLSDEGSSPADLVLKFRVCQIEKSIQTEVGTAPVVVEEAPPAPAFDPESSWVQCEGCEANGGPWETDERRPSRFNASKIWGSVDEFCQACDRRRAEARAERRRSGVGRGRREKEELAREWDELLSDISNAHNCGDPDDIAPEEISFRADDGDFVRIALEADREAYRFGRKADTVSGILDRSLGMYSDVESHCEACAAAESKGEGRKRRHSAAGGGRAGGAGKLRCTLPPPPARPLRAPLLAAADRPLTR